MNSNIANWLDRRIECYGNRGGLVCDGRLWTPTEIQARVQRLAGALRQLGVDDGQRVIVALANGTEALTSVLAIWRAGAVVVLAPVDSPTAEITAMANHCEAAAILHERPDRGAALPIPHGIDVRSDAYRAMIEAGPPLEVPRLRRAADLAQLAYTSGTTGTPKAVMLTHGGIDAHLRFLRDRGGERELVEVSLLPPTAMAGTLVIKVLAGPMTMVALRKFDPVEALRAIAAHRADVVSLVPSMAEALLTSCDPSRFDLSCLREILIGGATVSPDLLERISQGLGPAVVCYGMTELGGGVSFGGQGSAPDTVGRVLPDVQVRVVTEEGEPDALGELWIRTPWMGAGYFRNPEATAATFVDGWVRTGDLGRVESNGDLVLLGRKKDIIIQGGLNIDPVDITNIVGKLRGIDDCAVIGLPSAELGEQAIVCVVASSETVADEIEILNACRGALDPRKAPTQVIRVPAIPRTELGKVQTAVLRSQVEQWLAASATASALSASPSDPHRIEQEVTSLVAELAELDASRIDATTRFETYGLDSLQRVRLRRMLGTRFGVEVPDLARSVEQVCAHILRSQPTLGTVGALDRRPEIDRGLASAAQYVYWALSAQHPDDSSVANCLSFALNGPTPTEAVEEALNRIIARNPIYGTRYRSGASELEQIIIDRPVRIQTTDLSTLSTEERFARHSTLVRALYERAHDLAEEGVLRALLVTHKADLRILVLVIHHVAHDAHSLGAFAAAVARLAPSSDSEPCRYLDLCRAVHEWTDTSEGHAQLGYWRRLARTAQPVELPTDFDRRPVDRDRTRDPCGISSEAMHEVTVMLEPALSLDVRVAARRHGCTPSTLYVAAYALWLAEETRSTNVTVELLHSLRFTRLEFEPIAGPLLCWPVAVIDVVPDDPGETLRRTRTAIEDAEARALAQLTVAGYRSCSHELRRAGIHVFPDESSLQAMQAPVSGQEMVAFPSPVKPASIRRWGDLHVSIRSGSGRIHVTALAARRLFSAERAQGMAQRFAGAITALAAACRAD